MGGGGLDTLVSLIRVCSALLVTVPISDMETAIRSSVRCSKEETDFCIFFCDEEIRFNELDVGIEFGDGSRVTLAEVFGTIGCVREFFCEVVYVNLESMFIERDGG